MEIVNNFKKNNKVRGKVGLLVISKLHLVAKIIIAICCGYNFSYKYTNFFFGNCINYICLTVSN